MPGPEAEPRSCVLKANRVGPKLEHCSSLRIGKENWLYPDAFLVS